MNTREILASQMTYLSIHGHIGADDIAIIALIVFVLVVMLSQAIMEDIHD